MLKWISSLSISPFASIAEEITPKPEDILILNANDAFHCYQSILPVVVSPGLNMAVVQFAAYSDDPISYYLDKTIEIKPNTPFSLLPIDDQCIVYCRSALPLQKIPDLKAAIPPVINASFNVQRLCTIYVQDHEQDFFFSGEKHRPYEISYVNHGILHTVVDGQHFVLHQNEALIMPPGSWHVQYSEHNHPSSFFGATFLCSTPLPDNMLLHVFPEHKKAKELLQTLIDEMENDHSREYQNDLIITYFQALLLQYARFVENPQTLPIQVPSSLQNENYILARAMEYVAAHTHEHIRVTTLAKQCNVSAAYLSLLFKRHLNISPAAYVLQVKLEESKHMISNGEWNMTQISSILCFSSPQHFSCAFKRKYGVSPREYAKGLQNYKPPSHRSDRIFQD